MENIEILKKFVSGEMSIEEFKKIYFSSESLQNFLQEKLPSNMLINIDIKACNGSINEMLQKKCWDTKGGKSSIHGFIERWLQSNDIGFESTNIYSENYSFLITIMPDYINGNDAEALIDEIAKSVSENMPKTKRIKVIKEKIQEAFHLQNGKKPRWAQDTDWPFSETGKPMKFISQRQEKGSELVELTFEDVDTGEKIIIEDLY